VTFVPSLCPLRLKESMVSKENRYKPLFFRYSAGAYKGKKRTLFLLRELTEKIKDQTNV